MKVVPQDGQFLVIDTATHRIVGRHDSRVKAEKQRRYFRMMSRKRRKK